MASDRYLLDYFNVVQDADVPLLEALGYSRISTRTRQEEARIAQVKEVFTNIHTTFNKRGYIETGYGGPQLKEFNRDVYYWIVYKDNTIFFYRHKRVSEGAVATYTGGNPALFLAEVEAIIT